MGVFLGVALMNISLTPELAGFVKEQVESGMYHSASEVVREGLRLLLQQRQDRQARLEELRRQVAIGLKEAERGEIAPLDLEAIKAEGRRRLAERQHPEQREVVDG
jgi:antitoxin ParD1/3/4